MALRTTLALVAGLLAAAAPAAAAPPPNDTRQAATSLDPLPTTVSGTTVEATVDSEDTFTTCGEIGPGVWYGATAASAGRIALRVQAAGELDLVVEVFRRVRSRLDDVECDSSDGRGLAELNFAADAGDRFLVRVSEVVGSDPGTFTLRLSAPFRPATPPGRPLPAAGATGTLNRADHSDDAWSVVLRSGTTYRVRLSGRFDSCRPIAEIYAPGTASFDDEPPTETLSCGRTLVFTPRPGEGGRYPIRVVASRSARLAQGYHLQVAPAGIDDTAPGVPIHNHRRVAGTLRGDAVDGLDLYRFSVARRSQTVLGLSTGEEFDAVLLTEGGRRLGSTEDSMSRVLGPGMYFVAVRARGSAAGRYRLRRDSRVLTHTRLRVAVAGTAARLTSATAPDGAGPVRIVVERHDPFAGWLFAAQYDFRSGGGPVAATFAGRQGRYRAQAVFAGTRDAADSASRVVRFRLADPG
jgi:hypothetical protein